MKSEDPVTQQQVVAAIKCLDKCIEQDRQGKQERRFHTLLSLYDSFVGAHPELKDCVYLNHHLLRVSVKSYFDDIYKFKTYTKSERADVHKQAAYQIKWISRIRPVQILPGKEDSITALGWMVNAYFAVFVGFSFLFGKNTQQIMEKVLPKYHSHLVYVAQYRNISGRELAYSLCALQELCEIDCCCKSDDVDSLESQESEKG